MATLAVTTGMLTVGARTADAAGTVTVHPGHSIQAAIDAAAPGTTILVDEGTYAENLVIGKNDITLRGKDDAGEVRLVPPASGTPPCGGVGICIADIVGFDANGPITSTVHGVRVSRMTIKGFGDSGIFLADTDGSRVDHVQSLDNRGYGVFALQSTGVHMTDNVASGNHEAGFYVGESPHAAAVFSHNRSHGNGIGIFFRDSRGAKIEDNVLTGNCVGLVFLNTGQLPSGVGDAVARDNDADRNNLACPGGDGPPFSGIGIAILGGDHITLKENSTDRNVAGGPTIVIGGITVSGGIALVPGRSAPTTFVNVVDNNAHHNSTDILVVVPSSSNHFDDNDCTTSNPGGLCEA